MTEEENDMTEERSILDRAKQRVAHILADAPDANAQSAPPPQADSAPPRRRRRDAGVPRPPKVPQAPQVAGKLTREQSIRLWVLLEDVIQAEKRYWEADAARAKAGIAYNAFLDSLTA